MTFRLPAPMSLALLLTIPLYLGFSTLVNFMGESECDPIHVPSGSIMNIRVKHAFIPLSNIVYGTVVCSGQFHQFSPARLPSLYCPTRSQSIEDFVFHLCDPLPPINDTAITWFQDRGLKTHLRPPKPLPLIQSTRNDYHWVIN